MASGTDILFGGAADTSTAPAATSATVPTTDTSAAPDATIVVKPPASGTAILFGPSSADTTTAKPGDIDPLTGRPYAFATTANTPVATTLGKPIVEGRQPDADTQAIIGTATDPEQRRRIAAAQLFPNLSPKEAQARVFYGDDGRLAAVGEGGKPFYVDPLPLLSGGPAGDRPTRASPPPGAPASVPPDATWEQRVQASMPLGTYGSPSYQPAAGSVSPFTPGALNAPNVWGNVGRAVPNALSVGPMIAGDIVGGPVGVAAGSFASDYARQFVANRYDPQPGGNPYDYGAYAQNALINATVGGLAKEGSTMAGTAHPGLVTPAPLTAQQAEMARLAQVAKDNNIQIFPQQAPGAGPLVGRGATVANVLPFSGVPSVLRAQAENLTAAALKEAGDTSGAKALTPGVMADNFDRVGKGFDNVLPQMNAPIMANRDALTAIQKTAADAQRDLVNVAPDSLTKAKGLIDQVLNTAQANGGTIPGTDLQNMVRKGGLFDKIIGGNDPYLAGVAKELKGTLIDSAKAAPGAAGDAAQEWAKLRYQYKVLMTLDTPAIKSSDNVLTPNSLWQAVRSQWGDTAMAKGEAGTLGDLAKLGQMTKPMGSSGTWEHGGLYSTGAGLVGGVLALPASGWAPLIGATSAATAASAMGGALGMYFRKDLANKLANPNAYTGSSVVAGTAPAFVPQQRNPLQPP
jgi:hypothetical protein